MNRMATLLRKYAMAQVGQPALSKVASSGCMGASAERAAMHCGWNVAPR
jgi:hypothetical protein